MALGAPDPFTLITHDEVVALTGLPVGGASLTYADDDLKSMRIKASEDALKEQPHPCVRTHPETGRSILFVNWVYAIRFKDIEGEAYLQRVNCEYKDHLRTLREAQGIGLRHGRARPP